MARILKQDTDGSKGTLLKGELGYDDYSTGGDLGRVYVGTGTDNLALAKLMEVERLSYSERSGWVVIPNKGRQPYPSELFEETETPNVIRFLGWWYNFGGFIKFIPAQDITLPEAPTAILSTNGLATATVGQYVVLDTTILSTTGSNTYNQNSFYTYTGGGVGGTIGNVYKITRSTFTANINTVDFSNASDFEDFGSSDKVQCKVNATNQSINNSTYFEPVDYISNQDVFMFKYDTNTDELSIQVETEYIQFKHKVGSNFTHDEVQGKRGYVKGLKSIDEFLQPSSSSNTDSVFVSDVNKFIIGQEVSVIDVETNNTIISSTIRLLDGNNIRLDDTYNRDTKIYNIKLRSNIQKGVYTKGHDTKLYSHPIIRQTLNKGAYQPFFNERGCDGTTLQNGLDNRVWYSTNSYNLISVFDTFNNTLGRGRLGTLNTAYDEGTASQQNIRPDGRFYDKVYINQLIFNPCCTYGYNSNWKSSIISNNWEWGVEGLAKTYKFNQSGSNNSSTNLLLILGIKSEFEVGDTLYHNSALRIIDSIDYSGGNTRLHLTQNLSRAVNSPIIIKKESNILYRDTIPRINKLGNPTNDPQILQNVLQSGAVYGFSYLLIGQDNADYTTGIINLNSITLSSKALSYYNTLYSVNSGVTYSIYSHGLNSIDNNITNNFGINVSTEFSLLNYEAKCSIYKDFESIEILNQDTTMLASNSNLLTQGASILEPLGITTGTQTLESILCENRENIPKHNTIILGSSGYIAGKAIFSEGLNKDIIEGQININELRWDSSKDSVNDFTTISVSTNTSYTQDTVYRLNNIDFGTKNSLVIRCATNFTENASNIATAYYLRNSSIFNTSGVKVFDLWDGTGFGDTKEFNLSQGVSNDLNGNSVRSIIKNIILND